VTGDESFGLNPFKPPCLPGQPCYPGCRESPVLGPGEICAEWVRYIAPGGPTVYGRLWVTSDVARSCSGGSFSAVVSLVGAGKQPPLQEYEITVSPVAIDFGHVQVGAASPTQLFEVANTGDLSLQVTIEEPESQSFGLWVIPDTGCDLVQPLAPGESCEYAVRFAPESAGLHQAQLPVFSQDPDSPDVLELSGYGVE
jgi:hypothetical protein